MTQKISKHGTKYTVGSTQTKAGWEPQNCTVCGKRVIAKNGFFDFKHGSFHHECRKEWTGWEKEHGGTLSQKAEDSLTLKHGLEESTRTAE